MDTTSLPFEAFPARQRRPVIGALLVAAAYVLPIGLIIDVGGYEIVYFFSLGKKPTLLGEVLQGTMGTSVLFLYLGIYRTFLTDLAHWLRCTHSSLKSSLCYIELL